MYNQFVKIPRIVPLDKKGQYCISCHGGPIERIQDHKTHYKCHSCGKIFERSLVIDDGIVWWIDNERRYWHESVGVAVVNKEKKILCILRKMFPFAYALPAGHLDVGEDPEAGVRRELEEETGIKVSTALEHLDDFDISGDSCRRGSDDHRWHLYRLKLESTPDIKLSDEASEVRWFNLEELEKVDPKTYPLIFILQKFGASLIG